MDLFDAFGVAIEVVQNNFVHLTALGGLVWAIYEVRTRRAEVKRSFEPRRRELFNLMLREVTIEGRQVCSKGLSHEFTNARHEFASMFGKDIVAYFAQVEERARRYYQLNDELTRNNTEAVRTEQEKLRGWLELQARTGCAAKFRPYLSIGS